MNPIQTGRTGQPSTEHASTDQASTDITVAVTPTGEATAQNGSRTTSLVAGIALAAYGLLTATPLFASPPGGDFKESSVETFISPAYMWIAFGMAYLGILGALALLVFGEYIRVRTGTAADLVRSLTVVGSASSLVGWFVSGGIAVSMAEGGAPVRDAIPHSAVYALSEIANLLAVCSPALCVGLVAIVLAVRGGLPVWLRIFSVIAGLCGILAPLYFTFFGFVLWTVVAGIAIAVTRPRS